MNVYFIHDNYGRPFKVIINNNDVKVYKQKNHIDEYSLYPILCFTAKKIFIGKCSKTGFDGNSILLCLDNGIYIYIGSKIFRFNSLSEIVKFESPIGGSDVPYPYAVDTNNKYYLMIEDVLLKHIPNNEDPYYFYYKNSHITTVNNKIIYFNIKKYIIGDEEYNLSYNSRPHRDYNRISKWSDFGSGMMIEYNNGISEYLDKIKYVKLLKDYGKLHGFSYLPKVKVLCKRLY